MIAAIINQKYMLSAVCILLPLMAMYAYRSKLFRPTEDVRINKYIRNCFVLSYIFFLLIGIANILISFDITIQVALVVSCILSIAYTIIYGINHEVVYRVNKKFFIPFFLTAVILCVLVLSGVYYVPREFLEILIGDSGVTLYMLVPIIVGGKLVLDILLGLGICPSIAW